MKTMKWILAGTAMMWASATFAAGTPADANFAKKAAQSGTAEIAAGKLAVSQGESADVKAFGQHMIDDHTKASEDLKAAAAKDGIDLPASASPEQEAAGKKLAALNGAAFDKAYARMMVKDHQEAVALFKKESSAAGDSNVKAFAKETLPTLEDHLKMAKALGSSTAAKK